MQDYVTDYEEAVELLYRIPRFNSNHSLEKIKQFLTRMGQPDRQMKIVHIAGTNGKGSTSAYLAGLLEKSGYKVGLFTSPHLKDVRERFRINGRMISEELFIEALKHIQMLLDEIQEQSKEHPAQSQQAGFKQETATYTPCYFDMMFFIGMYAFCKEQVDILVLETGLGGRLDATNAVTDKVLTLITHIALDHTEYLGDTVEDIAREKAGIMMSHVPCIVAAHNEECRHIFLKKATELEAPCRILGKEDYTCHRVYEKAVDFSYFSRYYGNIPITLNTSALYQADNAGLALAGFEMLIEQGMIPRDCITAEGIRQALFSTIWEGRMEEVSEGVFLDGAHNVDGISAFLESVKADDCKGHRILIFSAVSDKDYVGMLQKILQENLFTDIIVTQIAGERGVTAEKLYEAARLCISQQNVKATEVPMHCMCIPDLQQAVAASVTKRKQFDYIYIVGSLYLVGQVKILFNAQMCSAEGKEHTYDSV